MKIKDKSIIDTVINYANVKFGVEIKQEEVSKQLKNMTFSQTLKLIDSIKNEDDDLFSEMIDLSAVVEAYGTATTSSPSSATIRAQGTSVGVANHRQKNTAIKSASTPAQRITPGAQNKTATAAKSAPDLDAEQRDGNTQQAQQNAADIERLKQLALGKR